MTLDRSVYNAARIWKLYGSVARKGEPLPERPHRRAAIISAPDPVELVTREQLAGAGPHRRMNSRLSGPSAHQVRLRGLPSSLKGRVQARKGREKAGPIQPLLRSEQDIQDTNGLQTFGHELFQERQAFRIGLLL